MNTKNYHKRFGKYPFHHPMNIFCFIIALSGVYFIINKSIYLGIYFIVSGMGGFLGYYHQFTEKFYINDNKIFHKKGKYEEQINIPEDAVFVISYTKLNFVYYKKYTVNIITESIDTTIKQLHHNDVYNKREMLWRGLYNVASYDNKMVKGFFKNRWCYSFIFDEQFAEQFFTAQQKAIIIPRSIIRKINLKTENFKIVIDENA